MPSMRPYALTPRAPVAPALPAQAPGAATAVAVALPAAASTEAEGDSPEDAAGSVGGFHESSYELQHGLQISESEWPDDVTLPGALDES